MRSRRPDSGDEASRSCRRPELSGAINVPKRPLSRPLLPPSCSSTRDNLPPKAWKQQADLHIDGGEGAVRDGTADGAGECEARVEREAAHRGRGRRSGGGRDDRVNLGHCDGFLGV